MGDYVPLPRKLSDFHIDGNTSDVDVKSSAPARRQRDKSNITTFEAPKRSRRQRDKSNIITFANPNAERSPSPSSRYAGTMDHKEFGRMEERRLEELGRRESSWTESDEVRSLRRQLRERDEECLAQRSWIKDLEREVKQVRQRLDTRGDHPGDGRPTHIKVHRKYLATETLRRFGLPWEYDPADPEYIVIKQFIDERYQNELFEHTRELKERERALREREERILMLEERESQEEFGRPVIIPASMIPNRRERYYEPVEEHLRRKEPRYISDGGDSRRRSRIGGFPAAPESDGWRVTGAAETPRDDVERPRPKGGPR